MVPAGSLAIPQSPVVCFTQIESRRLQGLADRAIESSIVAITAQSTLYYFARAQRIRCHLRATLQVS